MTSPIMIRSVSIFQNPGERPAQEDFVLMQEDRGIMVVADGFGGAVAGARAAQAACEAVRGYLVKEAGDLEATMPFVLRNYFSLAGNVLFNAVIHANRKVLQENKSKNVHEKGGASLIAGFLDGDLLALANVGSCSAWLFREGRVCDLVMPRSYGRLVDPFEGGRSIPHIQAPLMAMGMSEDLEPEICEYRVRSGDWLLLATDGVDLRVRDRILELYRNPKPLSEAARDVTEILNGLQCSDNASGSLMIF